MKENKTIERPFWYLSTPALLEERRELQDEIARMYADGPEHDEVVNGEWVPVREAEDKVHLYEIELLYRRVGQFRYEPTDNPDWDEIHVALGDEEFKEIARRHEASYGNDSVQAARVLKIELSPADLSEYDWIDANTAAPLVEYSSGASFRKQFNQGRATTLSSRIRQRTLPNGRVRFSREDIEKFVLDSRGVGAK